VGATERLVSLSNSEPAFSVLVHIGQTGDGPVSGNEGVDVERADDLK
jgi:hypothetical protein